MFTELGTYEAEKHKKERFFFPHGQNLIPEQNLNCNNCTNRRLVPLYCKEKISCWVDYINQAGRVERQVATQHLLLWQLKPSKGFLS